MPRSRPSPFRSMRTPRAHEVATELAFREKTRVKRKEQAHDTPVWPVTSEELEKKKKPKTQRPRKVEDERPVAEAIHLKYEILSRQQETARTDPNDAEDFFNEDLALIQAIIPGLKDEPANDVYLSDFRRLQKKYQKTGSN